MAPRRKLKEVAFLPAKQRAAAVKAALADAVEEALEQHGLDIAGFVLTTFDMRGDEDVQIHIEAGDIGHGKLPMYVHDAVQRKLTIETLRAEEDSDEMEPSG
jgi:hypothetical protein